MAKAERHPADPAGQKHIAEKRRKAAEAKQEAIAARQKQLVDAADPGGDHPNVLVVKRSEVAARQEQERLDIAAAAGARQFPESPPPLAPTKGTLPTEFVPAHPDEPGPEGSAPFDPTTPAGPMGENVVHVTGDIAADGTPKVQPGSAPIVPDYDGANDRTIRLRGPVDLPVDESDGPLINQHSEAGARIDAMKTGREVSYVPNDAALDPVANKPDRRD